ncbi:hypothetical protein XENORESO_018319 [Xenotaenia resolanae]|uniref:Uncharacterized protein n=1 Tax=Xenotaenia resolanae TaxID=208358 RepID=A0ABV0W7Q4_9TELE
MSDKEMCLSQSALVLFRTPSMSFIVARLSRHPRRVVKCGSTGLLQLVAFLFFNTGEINCRQHMKEIWVDLGFSQKHHLLLNVSCALDTYDSFYACSWAPLLSAEKRATTVCVLLGTAMHFILSHDLEDFLHFD